MSTQHKWTKRILLIAIFIFFYFPILYMMIFSFNESRSLTSFDGFSLRWYQQMFSDRTMMEAMYYTLLTAVLATAISTFVGTITAIGLSKSKRIVRDIVLQINDFPIMNPEIVTAVGLMLFYVSIKIEKGFLTLLLAHIAFCIPYVILSVMPKLKSLDPNLSEAAVDLGAKPTQAMFKVIMPQIMPGIISGALIAFTMSFDDFIISYFVTGDGVKNISTLVWTMSKRINPSINAVSTFIVFIITITLILINVAPFIKEKMQKRSKKVGRKSKFAILLLVFTLMSGSILYLKNGTQVNNKNDAIAAYGSDVLKVYNWGEYIDPQINLAFEKAYGVRVIYDTFDSNELMYTKLQGGESYDILVPSDYMIQRLINEKALMPLDKVAIPNLKELTLGVKKLGYDPDNTYSVPYFWGNVGIVYNKENVDIKDLEEDGFKIFNNQKYNGKIYLYDSERDMFMMALKSLGYSMNTQNPKQLEEAYQYLANIIKTMNPEIVMDEVIDSMVQGNKDIAMVYSGDATYILSENPDMGYYVPKQGTNLWSDAMVIPNTAKNPKLANEYINFMIAYEQSIMNTTAVGYTSVNQEVLDEVSGNDGEYYGNNAFLPRIGFEKDEIFEYHEESKKVISQYWTRAKMSK